MKADGEPLVLLPALYRRRLFLTVRQISLDKARGSSEHRISDFVGIRHTPQRQRSAQQTHNRNRTFHLRVHPLLCSRDKYTL
jgi:hypothetical protein